MTACCAALLQLRLGKRTCVGEDEAGSDGRGVRLQLLAEQRLLGYLLKLEARGAVQRSLQRLHAHRTSLSKARQVTAPGAQMTAQLSTGVRQRAVSSEQRCALPGGPDGRQTQPAGRLLQQPAVADAARWPCRRPPSTDLAELGSSTSVELTLTSDWAWGEVHLCCGSGRPLGMLPACRAQPSPPAQSIAALGLPQRRPGARQLRRICCIGACGVPSTPFGVLV